MSKIRLNGTSSGYTELAPPAAAGSNTITLPSSNGSANQFLKNGSTAGTLGWSSMVETASGVGIGTTSPAAKHHVDNGDNNIAQILSGSTSLIRQWPHLNSFGGCYIEGVNAAQTAYQPLGLNALYLSFGTGGSERARITSGGAFLVGQATSETPGEDNTTRGACINSGGKLYVSNTSDYAASINRNTDDGILVALRQAGVAEGTISVSGTTVAYNGAHLSRWSQIPGIDPHDKDVRPEILRGTVMSNLDEMCDWIDPDSGEAQANEQLNKTKISDVEGDKNVAGVFQSWDDDDDTWVNDFYLAMTGDFVIRIAEGVTVERGDLLISAGDGTAKPQDDDLIRSSTVAKVTSTTVSHVHPDGSFCVPCVLMAC